MNSDEQLISRLRSAHRHAMDDHPPVYPADTITMYSLAADRLEELTGTDTVADVPKPVFERCGAVHPDAKPWEIELLRYNPELTCGLDKGHCSDGGKASYHEVWLPGPCENCGARCSHSAECPTSDATDSSSYLYWPPTECEHCYSGEVSAQDVPCEWCKGTGYQQ